MEGAGGGGQGVGGGGGGKMDKQLLLWNGILVSE